MQEKLSTPQKYQLNIVKDNQIQQELFLVVLKYKTLVILLCNLEIYS